MFNIQAKTSTNKNVTHTFQHNIQNCKICQGGNSLEFLKVLETSAWQKKALYINSV